MDSKVFIGYINISMQSEAVYSLIKGAPPVPTEDDFSITEALSYMQRGLSASYDYSDFVYVVDDIVPLAGKKSARKQEGLDINSFKQSLSKLYAETFPKNFVPCKSNLKELSCDQLAIAAFDTQFWNLLKISKIDPFKPSWELPVDKRPNPIADNFPQRKKDFYKFNIKMLFQVKKNKPDLPNAENPLTQKIKGILSSHGLKYHVIQGESKQFCGVSNAIIAGRFNDGLQKPKDPYTFFLHCLLGYNKPEHLGGSYLLVQKCVLDWFNIHSSSQSLPGVLGRNDIKNGSTIFSQHHCPRSHIKLARIKDDQGNPVTTHRQSKSFTTKDFDPQTNRGLTDNIDPEQGQFFLAYQKDTKLIQKILLNQLGNNSTSSYADGLLNHFKVQHGNILYVPNIFEITGLSLKTPDINPKLSQLCQFHQTRWLKQYKTNQEDEQNHKTTGNQYFLYSRAGYMKKMSYSHQYEDDLHAPSPRTLRVLSRTFSLWQDTWYYDRSQVDFPHLTYFMKEKASVLDELKAETGLDVRQWTDYQKIPNVIRNGLAIHYNLGHVVSTKQYGCRGPIAGNPQGKFGANTFHLEPEDVLAGGQANLTFGQGKHLIEYLTESEMKAGWLIGNNLSAHSGIGHINAYIQQIMEIGLDNLTKQFKAKAASFKGKDQKKYHLFTATVFSLLGMKKYFINYSKLADEMLAKLGPKEVASKASLQLIRDTMAHLSKNAPVPLTPKSKTKINSLHQGAQLVLSVFICLHLTGEPVSLGRLDYALRKFANAINKSNYEPSQQQQEIIDSFWIKVGEKANFNKGFFEDHQKWGNLAMGGNSSPYPQGASFNQWGQQLTVGGTNPDNTPFYNSITIACLRAARRIPVNAPCLGLRVQKNTPHFIIQEATKTILAGGAHPIILNDQKVIAGLQRCGNYIIKKEAWDKVEIKVDGKPVDVPYENWNTLIKVQDRYDYGSDGCHEFLPIGKSWFWLGGGDTLTMLQYVINEGKNLLSSGPRYIYGQRRTYRWRKLETYTTYQQFEDQYFQIFEEIMQQRFTGQLSGFPNLSKVCPATLLNAFTADMRKRQSDFYENGASYRLFAPQYTGVANLANALWNIKTLVFQKKVTTLQEIRNVLLVNWGDELDEPFVPRTLPPIMRAREKERCDMLREVTWRQPKFGLDEQVTAYGQYLSKKMSRITRKIFQQPSQGLLTVFKNLTHQFGTKSAPFGFQYLPGCGTFENFADAGASLGASFDGRKKAQALAEDYAPQNLLLDINVNDPKFEVATQYLSDILHNYTHTPESPGSPSGIPKQFTGAKVDPEFFSGAVLDLNINEDYDRQILAHEVQQFAKGAGPNMITISTSSRKLLQEARTNTDRDLLRTRQGGWSEFLVAMFPHLLEHHIRRVRGVAKAVTSSTKQAQHVQAQAKQLKQAGQPKKKVKKD